MKFDFLKIHVSPYNPSVVGRHDHVVNERVKQLILQDLSVCLSWHEDAFCLSRSRARRTAGSALRSRILGRSGCGIRNGDAGSTDAARARCSCILPYTRMRALKRAGCIIEMHYPLPPSLPPLPLLPHSLSLSPLSLTFCLSRSLEVNEHP